MGMKPRETLSFLLYLPPKATHPIQRSDGYRLGTGYRTLSQHSVTIFVSVSKYLSKAM